MNLFEREFFWLLSGGDGVIIRKCDQNTQNQYTLTGVSVSVILVLCFISSWFAFKSLFNSHVVGISIALFFAAVIFNLYLLMQTTISRDFLPVPHNRDNASKFSKGLSLFIRLGFIVFLSIIVAKPIEEMILSSQIDKEIMSYKQNKIDYYVSRVELLHRQELVALKEKIKWQEYLILNSNNVDSKLLLELRQELMDLNNEMESEIHRTKLMINQSEYFIQRIKILSTNYRGYWLLTACFTAFFLLPIVLKFLISNKESQYYRQKSVLDEGIIINHYDEFKKKYTSTFKRLIDLDVSFEEKFEKPPFNVSPRKSQVEYKKQSDLLDLVYNDGV
jgi:hypothetical protein